MASNHLTINNETREFVWEIEQKTPQKTDKSGKAENKSRRRSSSEPTLVKDAVARYFNKISEGLYERLEALEQQVTSLQEENRKLQENCAGSCSAEIQYVNDNIYNPWYC